MKSVCYKGARNIEIRKVEPIRPSENEVMLQIAYCGICGTDLHIYHGDMDKRVRLPHIMGHECSAIVVEIGRNVTHVKTGDHVVVRPLSSCGQCAACRSGYSHICYKLDFLGVDSSGAMQQYWTVIGDLVHLVPNNLSLKLAALMEPIAVACHDVRLGEVANGNKVVVIGSGPIGILIAMVARYAGAEVMVSEINEYRRNIAREMGFETVDPSKVNLEELVNQWTDGAGADIAFEVSGSTVAAKTITQLLRSRGCIVIVAIYNHKPPINLHQVFWRELRIHGSRVYEREDFDRAIEIVASMKLPLERIISKVVSMEELGSMLSTMREDPYIMKVLVDCRK